MRGSPGQAEATRLCRRQRVPKALTRHGVKSGAERRRCQPRGARIAQPGNPRAETGRRGPRSPARRLPALWPAVAKGRRRAGITCKRRRPSCRGRSGSRPPLEPPLSSGSSSKTAAGRPTSSVTVQSPMAAFSTLATRRQPPQPPPS